jgi:hypothetical protein
VAAFIRLPFAPCIRHQNVSVGVFLAQVPIGADVIRQTV